MHRERYLTARRYDKFAIADEIVKSIKDGGAESGRFLKRVEGQEYWLEVTDSVAREKVSHALRGKPRKEDSPSEQEDSVTMAPRTHANTGNNVNLPTQGARLPMPEVRHDRPLIESVPNFYNSPLVPLIPMASLQQQLSRGLLPPNLSGLSSFPAVQPPYGLLQSSQVLRQGIVSNYAGISTSLLSEQQIIEAMLQRRQRGNDIFQLPRLPPHF